MTDVCNILQTSVIKYNATDIASLNTFNHIKHSIRLDERKTVKAINK